MDIKNSLEALEALKVGGVFGKKVFADGKVNVLDLPLLMELGLAAGVLVAAVDGMGEIPAEVKELSQDEAQQLIAKLFEVFAAIKAA